MEIKVKRIFKGSTYTIGHLYCDGEYLCDTIEDVDRGLTQEMTEEAIRKKKIYAKTAIPFGSYKLTINVVSPKFSKKEYYKNFCDGRLPRILGVKGFDGILIHRGISEKNSAGCIIVGYNKLKGQLVDSQKAFELLYKRL